MNIKAANPPELLPVSASSRMNVLKVGFIGFSYFLAHQAAFLFPDSARIIMAIWPAGGIGLASLLLNPRRQWPVILPVLFISGMAADLWVNRGFLLSAGFMTANILESLACAWLISRWCGGGVRFTRAKEVLALIVAATGVNTCTSLVGAGTAALISTKPFWSFWQTWWTADALGILLIAPLIVTWAVLPRSLFSRVCWPRVIELGISMVLWCVVAWVLFQSNGRLFSLSLQPYMLMPLIVWFALRFGQRSVMTALFALTAIAITSESMKTGIFPWLADDPAERLLTAQIFFGIVASTGMLLSAVHTERMQGAERLIASEARYRRLFETAQDGILILEAETGLVVDVNPFLIEMLGFSHASFLGKKIWEVGFFKDREASKINFRELQENDYIRYDDLPLETADGRQIDVEFISSGYEVNERKVIQCNIRNITERKRADEIRTKLVDAKSKFTSTVSHELRSPLATIKAATDLVLDGLAGPVSDEQKNLLGIAKENIDRLGRMANNVLTYKKIEAGKMRCDVQENDLNELIREVYKSAVLFAGNRKADFILELEKDLPRIKFDKDKIFQVLMNLMTNAFKYSEKGNMVLKTRRENNEVHVSVRDFGPGIKAEHLGGLFEPFSQEGENQKGGTGLGLAIAKEIVLAHHGRIWVESEVGKGSAFHFILPL